jgi:Flp pilus assembly protein CpaB
MKYVESRDIAGRVISSVKRHSLIASTLVLWAVLIGVTYFTIKNSAWSDLTYTSVLVASKAITQGSVITKDMLSSAKFLNGYIPKNSISVENIDEVMGKTALVTMDKGDVISPSVVSIEGDAAGRLASVIGKDKKIMTFSSADVHTIPEVLRVGDRITIYAVDPKANTKMILMSEVEILQIIRKTSDDNKSGEIISFAIVAGDDGVLNISESLAKENFLQIAIEPRG